MLVLRKAIMCLWSIMLYPTGNKKYVIVVHSGDPFFWCFTWPMRYGNLTFVYKNKITSFPVSHTFRRKQLRSTQQGRPGIKQWFLTVTTPNLKIFQNGSGFRSNFFVSFWRPLRKKDLFFCYVGVHLRHCFQLVLFLFWVYFCCVLFGRHGC